MTLAFWHSVVIPCALGDGGDLRGLGFDAHEGEGLGVGVAVGGEGEGPAGGGGESDDVAGEGGGVAVGSVDRGVLVAWGVVAVGRRKRRMPNGER